MKIQQKKIEKKTHTANICKNDIFHISMVEQCCACLFVLYFRVLDYKKCYYDCGLRNKSGFQSEVKMEFVSLINSYSKHFSIQIYEIV